MQEVYLKLTYKNMINELKKQSHYFFYLTEEIFKTNVERWLPSIPTTLPCLSKNCCLLKDKIERLKITKVRSLLIVVIALMALKKVHSSYTFEKPNFVFPIVNKNQTSVYEWRFSNITSAQQPQMEFFEKENINGGVSSFAFTMFKVTSMMLFVISMAHGCYLTGNNLYADYDFKRTVAGMNIRFPSNHQKHSV